MRAQKRRPPLCRRVMAGPFSGQCAPAEPEVRWEMPHPPEHHTWAAYVEAFFRGGLSPTQHDPRTFADERGWTVPVMGLPLECGGSHPLCWLDLWVHWALSWDSPPEVVNGGPDGLFAWGAQVAARRGLWGL
jgi:hypothetical protein